MKICAVICEFNPFHNGHKYLLERARELSGCDFILCIMSGSFTQRGDLCVTDKFTRARHAVLGGADCVLELAAPFAVAPAEIFASGAVKILSSIPEVAYLAFGCEDVDTDFIKVARTLLSESTAFKKALSENLGRGESYIKSYARAFTECGGDTDVLTKPNNILGIEYAKAILKNCSDMEILPVRRVGAGYNDGKLRENFSSASAIRENLSSPLVYGNLPRFVAEDLPSENSPVNVYKDFARFKLFLTDGNNLKSVCGCGEGLENRLKSLEKLPYDQIIQSATSRRYSSARIKRILCANLLDLYEDDCKKYLNSELYLRVLAVKKDCAKVMLPALSRADFPLIADGSYPVRALCSEAENCLKSEQNSFALWNFINNKNVNDKMIVI